MTTKISSILLMLAITIAFATSSNITYAQDTDILIQLKIYSGIVTDKSDTQNSIEILFESGICQGIKREFKLHQSEEKKFATHQTGDHITFTLDGECHDTSPRILSINKR